MKSIKPVATATHPLIRASWDADAAWTAELVRTFGKRANAARWDHRGTSTPELAALYRERLEAMEAEHAMWEAYRAHQSLSHRCAA